VSPPGLEVKPSGNGDSGNGDSGIGDSGNGDSGNGDSGNGGSGNGGSGKVVKKDRKPDFVDLYEEGKRAYLVSIL
jgi:hypothetical protein